MAEINPLIAALRAASMPGAANPGIRFYDNAANGSSVSPFFYTGMAFNPPVLGWPTGSNPPPGSGGSGGRRDTGGGGGSTVTRPGVTDPIIGLPVVIDDDPVIDPERPDIAGGTDDGGTGGNIIDTGLVIDETDDDSNTDPIDEVGQIDVSDMIGQINGVTIPPITDLDPDIRDGVVEINQDVDYDGYSSFEDPNSSDAVNGADLESDLSGIEDDEEFQRQLERLSSQSGIEAEDPNSAGAVNGSDLESDLYSGGGGGNKLSDDELLSWLAWMELSNPDRSFLGQ